MAMPWNPADEFIGPEPVCEACDGSGVFVFATTVYEPGCGFSHASSDERPCAECGGTGRPPRDGYPSMRRALEMDGEKLRQLTGEDHGPWFDEAVPF